jgi:hypothetical protein
MTKKEEKEKEQTYQKFGKKIDQFMDELNEAGERLHKEFKERYEELKVSAERMKKEAKDKERWKEVERNLKSAGDELKNAFNNAFRKKK